MKRFRTHYICSVCVLSLFLLLFFKDWLVALVDESNYPVTLWIHGQSIPKIFIATIPIVLVVLLFRVVHDRFYRNGYYTDREAEAFYRACSEQEIDSVQVDNQEICIQIYKQAVADIDLAKNEETLKLLREIYERGQKQRKGS